MGIKGECFLGTRLGDPEDRCGFSGSLDQALTPQTRRLTGHELGGGNGAASARGPQGGLSVPIHEQYDQLSAKGASLPPGRSEQPEGAWGLAFPPPPSLLLSPPGAS